MKPRLSLSFLLLIFIGSSGYAQLPQIVPNNAPIILTLGANANYTIAINDIATVISPPGSTSEVDFSPKSFNCSNLGKHDIMVTATNSTNRHPAAASFRRPQAVVFDSKGNLYVAEDGHEIRKIDPSGQVTLFAGADTVGFRDGPGTTAQFNSPLAIVADAADNLYVTDSGNQRIRKIDPNGVVSTLAGNGNIGDSDGPGDVATFSGPVGIALDKSGNVYVTDQGDHTIRKITPGGMVSTVAGTGQPGYADGQGTAASFNFPVAIAADAAGNLFVADANNHVIREIDPSGMVSTYAGPGTGGSIDSTRANASFTSPSALCFDAGGNLYVGDDIQVREISTAGMVTTIAGSGSSGSADGPGPVASFIYISGICIDRYGVIYVADPNTFKVRQICTDSVVSTLAGTGVSGTNNGNIGSIQISDCPVKAVIPITMVDYAGTCRIKTVFIPNTFTPNGDNINDVWDIPGLLTHPDCTVFIYDRYGQQVFKSTGYNTPWNGRYKGNQLPFGVYYYVINLATPRQTFSGSVTILR